MGVVRTTAGALAAALWLGIGAQAATAAPVTLCIPTSGGNVTAPSSGTCGAGTVKKDLVEQADLDAAKARVDALEAKLADVSKVTVNGQPTLRFSGVNLQLVNGAGATSAKNGLGNLVVGYNESPGSQTGSHNLIMGTAQTVTGYSGLLNGRLNRTTGAYNTALGYANTAIANYAGVTGGTANYAATPFSAIAGGCSNKTGGTAEPDVLDRCRADSQTVLGGSGGWATGATSAISGGRGNRATGLGSAVTGGLGNTAGGDLSAVATGLFNKAMGPYAGILGGYYNEANGQFSSATGGYANDAHAQLSTVTGGIHNQVLDDYGVVVGGCGNIAGVGALPDCSAFTAGHEAILGGVNKQVGAAGATSPPTP